MATPATQPWSGKKKNRPMEFIGERVVAGVAMFSLVFIALIFIFVFREAAGIFLDDPGAKIRQKASSNEYETYGDDAVSTLGVAPVEQRVEQEEESLTVGDLLAPAWFPVSNFPKYGLLPLIWASIKVAIIAILLGAPIAILAAIYTSMFAPGWAKEWLKPGIEMLAGFPSVVIGFFALIVMATIFQNIFGYQYRLNAFVGGAALSLAVIPVIFTISDDALSTVPKSLIEASLALGASKWETVFFVALPDALPGIFAAVLLGIGRAVGETMIVLMATGNAALFTFSAVDPVRTLSATIGAEMAEVVFGDTHYSVLFIIGVLLFIFSFLLNMTAEVFVRDRLMRRFRGA